MTRALTVVQLLLAGAVLASAAVVAARRRSRLPLLEVGLSLVVLTNLATILPWLSDDSAELAPWLLVAAMVAWLLVLFTFPDGRPAPGWMLWILVAASTGIGLSLFVPSGAPGRVVVFASAFSVGVGAQVWRFRRRSTVSERQATKWLLVGLLPAATVFVGIGLVVSTTSLSATVFEQGWYLLVSVTAIWLVPVAAAVGLVAPERAPIDALLRTSIVTFGTGLALTWTYLILLPRVGPSWSAAAAVISLVPIRSVLGRLAISIVYAKGHKSPVLLLEQRLSDSVREQEVASVVAGTIAEGLSLPYVVVRLRGVVASEVGDPERAGTDRQDLEVFPVYYLGTEVAEIAVAPRPGDTTLAGRDREILHRLAASAGAALHGAGTLVDLSLARERLVVSREEERRRLRRDLHDDLAPTLAGLGLRAAAAASLSAVDPQRSRQLYAEVQEAIHAAIAQVRDIAHDLRPPMLDDLGLEAAIRDRLGTEVDPDLVVEVAVRALPPELPAAVELAALRIVQEAVTNVRRHAEASSCQVILAWEGTNLSVSIHDDGRGIPTGHLPGVGLRSIEERATELGGSCHIESKTGGGTLVTVLLPVREGACLEGATG